MSTKRRKTKQDIQVWIKTCLDRLKNPDESEDSKNRAKAQIVVLLWVLGYSIDEAYAYIENEIGK